MYVQMRVYVHVCVCMCVRVCVLLGQVLIEKLRIRKHRIHAGNAGHIPPGVS